MFEASWRVCVDGEVAESGDLAVPRLDPGASAELAIPFITNTVPSGATATLEVRFVLGGDTRWGHHGHEIAWEQFPIDLQTRPAPQVVRRSAPVSMTRSSCAIEVEFGSARLKFDLSSGLLRRWRVNEVDRILRGPQFQLWRAPIDNDRNYRWKWQQNGFDHMTHRVNDVIESRLDDGVRVLVKTRVAPPVHGFGYEIDYEYTIGGDGVLSLKMSGTPVGDWPDAFIPRLGLQMVLPASTRNATWLGRGPGENYDDSRLAARFGLWRSSIDALHTDYIKPQENGNRGGNKFVAFAGEQGEGVLVYSEEPFAFSAQHYSTDDLTKTTHNAKLVRREEVYVNLDHKQLGLGSNSCGPGPLDAYQLRATPFEFTLRFATLHSDGVEPLRVYRHLRRSTGTN
jgi:beta-galactosidase/evolved beta-galactosidase subunit alpha